MVKWQRSAEQAKADRHVINQISSNYDYRLQMKCIDAFERVVQRSHRAKAIKKRRSKKRKNFFILTFVTRFWCLCASKREILLNLFIFFFYQKIDFVF